MGGAGVCRKAHGTRTCPCINLAPEGRRGVPEPSGKGILADNIRKGLQEVVLALPAPPFRIASAAFCATTLVPSEALTAMCPRKVFAPRGALWRGSAHGSSCRSAEGSVSQSERLG